MRELIQKIHDEADFYVATEKKEILKFCKRLESYIHAPTNKKEIDRMLEFASNESLVSLVLKILENYQHPEKSGYPFDIISYWYCICLLIHSKQKNATAFVLNLANQFLKNKQDSLSIFRRIFKFIEYPEYKEITANIGHYYLSLQPELESYQWAKEIGLELPTDHDWAIFFYISTDGKAQFGNELTAKEKEERLNMAIGVYPLRGDNCWDINLKNWNQSVSAWWPMTSEREVNLYNIRYIFKLKPSLLNLKTYIKDVKNIWNNKYVLRTKPSLRNLKEVIKEIETICNVTFDKTIYSLTVQGKVKNRNAIQKWLKEEK